MGDPTRCPANAGTACLSRQIGWMTTRYRGLVKNRTQIFTLFALGNLFLFQRNQMARGLVCPQTTAPPQG